MKLVVREHINKIIEPVEKKFTISVVALEKHGMIPSGIGLAKGDLIVYRGADDPIRLQVGNADTVLTADPTQLGGVRWAAAGGASSGAKTLLHNSTGAQILKGTILYLLDVPEQIINNRECTKALPYSDDKLYVAAEDAANGEDIECFGIPGTICQILVTGAVNRMDPIVVSSTAGIGLALPGGVPTVGIAVADKAASAVGLVSCVLVSNDTQMISNADSVSHANGTVYAFSGGYDTDGFGNVAPNVKAADFYGSASVGVQAAPQVNSGGLTIMHSKQGQIVKVSADETRIDVGDWLVPSADTAGTVRSGIGNGIGHALEAKAGGSTGKIRALLQPFVSGKGPKKYLYYQGEKLDEAWSESLTFQTEGGNAYDMTRMADNSYTLYGAFQGWGTEERSIYVRSSAIDVTNYSRLVFRFGYTASDYNVDIRRNIYFGLANPGVSTVKHGTISSLFSSAYDSIFPAASKPSFEPEEYELDISSLSGSYNLCLVWGQENLSGTVAIAIQYAYLM